MHTHLSDSDKEKFLLFVYFLSEFVEILNDQIMLRHAAHTEHHLNNCNLEAGALKIKEKGFLPSVIQELRGSLGGGPSREIQ